MLASVKLRTLIVLGLSLFLVQCGSQLGERCAPSHSGDKLNILVTRVIGSINQYEVTVCSSTRTNNNSISVYGVIDESDIAVMNLNSRVRLARIEDNSRAGDSFIVQFNNDDTFFIIYEDSSNGSLSRSTELVRGSLFQ